MKFIGKMCVSVLVLFAFSCGENSSLDEETIYFQEENKAWISNDDVGDSFVLIDTNQIEQNFSMKTNSYYFNKSWGSFLGITTDMTHSEYHYQMYSSSFGSSFSLSLSAGFPPFGDRLCVNINQTGFTYDLKFKTLSSVDSNFGIKSKTMTEDGYELNGEKIYSTVEFLDTYESTNKSYEDVICFNFLDYKDSWKPFTIIKIYVAKNVGLIKYETNSGAVFERK